MIHFLKPKGGRRKSQPPVDVTEHSSVYSTADVADDWSGESTALTDDEAAEIQRAFQQQTSEATALDDLAVLTNAAPTAMSESVELTASPLDLTQLEPFALDVEATPLELPADESLATTSHLSAPVTASDSECVSHDEANVPTPESLAPMPMVAEPELAANVASDAFEQLAAEFNSSPAVELVELEEAAQDVAVDMNIDMTLDMQDIAVESSLVRRESSDLMVATVEPDADTAPVAVDLAISSISLDDISGEVVTTDEADVVIATDADASVESLQNGPLTYFQYYLDEDVTGGADKAEVPAPYVTPWHQPSVPGGLIGAGVLGATLVSGFVIADTVKTQPLTAVKKPQTPSPLQSLSPKDQVATAAVPQVVSPEVMQPEVALPQPKTVIATQPILANLPTLGQASATTPLAVAAAPVSNAGAALPQSSAVVETITPSRLNTAVAAPESISNDSIATSPLKQLQVSPVPASSLPQPKVPVVDTVKPQAEVSSPATELLKTTPQSSSDLPQLQPNTSMPLDPVGQDTTATPVVADQALPTTPSKQPVVGTNPMPEVAAGQAETISVSPIAAERSTVETTSPVDLPATATVAPPVNVVVPTEVATPEVPSSTPTATMPADRVFTRDTAVVPEAQSEAAAKAISVISPAAPAAMPPLPDAAMPIPVSQATVPAGQPVADTTDLPAPLKTLLAKPENRGYQPISAQEQWRSLTQREAVIAARADQLGEFTRQQLSQQDYIAAYRSVSRQANVLPPFGFIDYQRQLILLPPQPATALNETAPNQSHRSLMKIIAGQAVTL
ncbi:hypothetical protein IQ266_10970 [filamentous cyanobacterium LEGE 11480]|uniref:Uncharacterized protein n=1 Tax=Romeriopsis navalis LEGE 11480 TaxID=2777977 RepID=A0A928VMB3_9CYAN|nr:hypothetical protein [Romeriopsis navalis]MBE9030252.1 hypothetical protein [Romeriopsis navalis LEGE 11480]